MPRANIASIARAAGVSTATVDRALNGRAGVSPANRQRVLTAARDLGYLPSAGMVVLPARPARLAFLIPMGQNAFMRDLIAHLTEFSASLPLVAACEIIPLAGIDPENLDTGLDALPLDTEGVGVIATDHARCRSAMDRLCQAGVRVVTIATDIKLAGRSAYVGVDNYAAGRTAAQMIGMMTQGMAGQVAMLLGSRDFLAHHDRARGFTDYVQEHCPALALLPAIETGEMSSKARQRLEHLMAGTDDLRAVYCIGAGRRGVVEAVAQIPADQRPRVVIHDLTGGARDWLSAGVVDAVIDQNVRQVAEQSVIRLLGAIATSTPLLRTNDIEPRIILRENLPAG